MTRESKKKINAYIQKIEDSSYVFDNQDEAFSHAWKWKDFFWNNNDIVLEIGTGLGKYFSTQVAKNPNQNYIGKEIRFKRLHITEQKTLEKWAKNFCLICTKWENIDQTFGDWELSQTYIFFPDPWANKERQRKHRLMQKEFLENLAQKTKLWWKLFFKTDHREYFDSTLEILAEITTWKTIKKSYDYEQELIEFDKKNMTEFEEIFREQKLEICYIELERI